MIAFFDTSDLSIKTRTLKHSFSILLAGGLLLALNPLQAEPRTWTSADGRTLNAEFVGSAGAGASAVVKLKMADGTVIDYPVSKLSEQDRLFVKGNPPTGPAAPAADSDQLAHAKLTDSYYGLRCELAATPAHDYLTPTDKTQPK